MMWWPMSARPSLGASAEALQGHARVASDAAHHADHARGAVQTLAELARSDGEDPDDGTETSVGRAAAGSGLVGLGQLSGGGGKSSEGGGGSSPSQGHDDGDNGDAELAVPRDRRRAMALIETALARHEVLNATAAPLIAAAALRPGRAHEVAAASAKRPLHEVGRCRLNR